MPALAVQPSAQFVAGGVDVARSVPEYPPRTPAAEDKVIPARRPPIALLRPDPPLDFGPGQRAAGEVGRFNRHVPAIADDDLRHLGLRGDLELRPSELGDVDVEDMEVRLIDPQRLPGRPDLQLSVPDRHIIREVDLDVEGPERADRGLARGDVVAVPSAQRPGRVHPERGRAVFVPGGGIVRLLFVVRSCVIGFVRLLFVVRSRLTGFVRLRFVVRRRRTRRTKTDRLDIAADTHAIAPDVALDRDGLARSIDAAIVEDEPAERVLARSDVPEAVRNQRGIGAECGQDVTVAPFVIDGRAGAGQTVGGRHGRLGQAERVRDARALQRCTIPQIADKAYKGVRAADHVESQVGRLHPSCLRSIAKGVLLGAALGRGDDGDHVAQTVVQRGPKVNQAAAESVRRGLDVERDRVIRRPIEWLRHRLAFVPLAVRPALEVEVPLPIGRPILGRHPIERDVQPRIVQCKDAERAWPGGIQDHHALLTRHGQSGRGVAGLERELDLALERLLVVVAQSGGDADGVAGLPGEEAAENDRRAALFDADPGHIGLDAHHVVGQGVAVKRIVEFDRPHREGIALRDPASAAGDRRVVGLARTIAAQPRRLERAVDVEAVVLGLIRCKRTFRGRHAGSDDDFDRLTLWQAGIGRQRDPAIVIEGGDGPHGVFVSVDLGLGRASERDVLTPRARRDERQNRRRVDRLVEAQDHQRAPLRRVNGGPEGRHARRRGSERPAAAFRKRRPVGGFRAGGHFGRVFGGHRKANFRFEDHGPRPNPSPAAGRLWIEADGDVEGIQLRVGGQGREGAREGDGQMRCDRHVALRLEALNDQRPL